MSGRCVNRRPHWTRPLAHLAAGLVVVVVAAGCSRSDSPAAPPEESTSATTDTTEPPASAPRVSIQGLPDTPAGRRFEEVTVAALAGALTEDDVTARFDAVFLEQIPARSFVAQIGPLPELLGSSPVVANLTINAHHAVAGTLLNPADGTRWAFATSVGVTEPHLVVGYSIVPDPTPRPDPSIVDLDGATDAWSALGARSDLLVTELVTGAEPGAACEPAADASEEVLSIGSGFKLWVLAALVVAIDEGRLAWADQITIDERRVSLPSGQLQVEVSGTRVGVADAAALMIGVSDNTATDHLIDLVGRDAVEEALVDTRHHAPDLNRPLLTTREFFQLKLGDPARLDRYRAAGETERRLILDELSTEPLPEVTATSFTGPSAIDVEWLATTGDLCRVITWLDARSDDHPELAAALTAGRGSVDRRAWPNVAFKGGSEPGVLSLTWLATDADGRQVVVVGIANDPDRDIDSERATAITQRVFELLAAG